MSKKALVDYVREAVNTLGAATPHERTVSNYALSREVARLRGLSTKKVRTIQYRTIHKLGERGVAWDTIVHEYSYKGGPFGRGNWERGQVVEVLALNPHYVLPE